MLKQRGEAPIAKNARQILRFLARRKTTLKPLLILTHNYPDPDALASASALQYIAERVYKISSRIAYGGIIGRMENRAMVQILRMPVHKLRPKDFKRYRCVALIDTQPAFENNSFPKNRKASLVIDQHPSDKKPHADFSVVNTECGATSVILAQCLLLSKIEIPVKIATSLAYGILSDTLSLYRSHHPEVVQTYLDILSRSDLKVLGRIQNPPRSRQFFTTLSKGILRARVIHGLVFSHLGVVQNPDLVAQVADFLLTYKGMNWSLCTGRFKGRLHLSLRSSKANAQAGEVLRDVMIKRGQAGGHDLIAGGSLKLGGNASNRTWRKMERFMIERLLKRLRIPAKKEFYYPFR